MKSQFPLLYVSSAKNCAIVRYFPALHLKRSNAHLMHSHPIIDTITNSEQSNIYPIKVCLPSSVLHPEEVNTAWKVLSLKDIHISQSSANSTLSFVCLTLSSISCPLYGERIFWTSCIDSYLTKICKFKCLQQY